MSTEPLSPDPVFLDAPNNSTVYEGETVVLQCRVQSVSKAHLKVTGLTPHPVNVGVRMRCAFCAIGSSCCAYEDVSFNVK